MRGAARLEREKEIERMKPNRKRLDEYDVVVFPRKAREILPLGS